MSAEELQSSEDNSTTKLEFGICMDLLAINASLPVVKALQETYAKQKDVPIILTVSTRRYCHR